MELVHVDWFVFELHDFLCISLKPGLCEPEFKYVQLNSVIAGAMKADIERDFLWVYEPLQ